MAICSFCQNECKNNRNKNPKNSFCNRECYYKFKHEKILKFECYNCKKITLKSKKDSETPKNIYCSRKCMCEKRNEGKESQCKKCNEKIVFNGARKTDICRKCYHNEYKEKYPEKSTSNKLVAQRKRIKKGLPLDHQFKKKNGSGHISRGYKIIRKVGHPNSYKNGCIMEHQFIMSEYLGRPLIKGELVHHKNGIRDDNRLENLELWNKEHPSGQRVTDRIDYYIKFLETYGYEVKIK